MNFYPHHIGDFNNATRHLTRIERSIYRDLIELYYDTELPLTLDMKALCRKVLARTEEESTAVEQVLNEFFTKTAQGWHHARCEQEIAGYHANISAKSAAGKASAAKREAQRLARLAELNGCSTADEQVLDSVECSVQLTNNQEPITNNRIDTPPAAKSPKPAKKNKTPLPADFGISERVAKWAKSKGYGRLNEHLENFIRACEKAGYTYVNWDSAFIDAIDKDWAKLRQPASYQQGAPPPSRPIPSIDEQIPSLAGPKGKKPEGLDLKALLKKEAA